MSEFESDPANKKDPQIKRTRNSLPITLSGAAMSRAIHHETEEDASKFANDEKLDATEEE